MSDPISNCIEIEAPSKLLKRFRTGKIKGPQQVGFDNMKLIEEISRSVQDGKNSSDDFELVLTASIFDKLFKGVRDRIDERKSRSPNDRLSSIHAAVAVSNYEWLKLKENADAAMEGQNSIIAEELDQQTFETLIGNPMHLNNAIDTLVDGLKYELARCYCLASGDELIEINHSQLVDSQQLVSLAGYYGVLEHYWMQVVWNQYRVMPVKDVNMLYPKNDSLHRNISVGMHRRVSLYSERTMHWAKYTNAFKDAGALGAYYERRKVISIYKKKGVYRLKASAANRFADEAWANPGTKDVLYQEYLRSTLDKKYSSLKGLTPQHILDAYEILNYIPTQFSKFVKERSYYEGWNQLKQLVPIFQFSELIKVFSEILCVSEVQSKFIVDFLRWNPSYRSAIWFSPLLPLDGDHFTLSLPSVDGVNYIRMADWIISKFKDIRKVADSAFENYIRNDIINVSNDSPIADQTYVHPTSYKPSEANVGDIDILFRVGSIVWVAEAKSTENAFDPLETYQVSHRLVREGCVQVDRKKKYVREHIGEVARILEYDGAPEDLVIEGLIIVSNPLFAGTVINQTPVVDEHMISLFFREGELKREGYLNNKLERVHLSKIRFYTKEDNIADAFRVYVYDPPQTKILLKSLVPERSIMPDVSGDETIKVCAINYDIQLPLDGMKHLIEKIGIVRGDFKAEATKDDMGGVGSVPGSAQGHR